jgi:hypothetical protein
MVDRGEWALPGRRIQVSVSSYVDLYVRKLRLIPNCAISPLEEEEEEGEIVAFLPSS